MREERSSEMLKVKYPLISSKVNFDDSYLTNSAFDCYIKKFVQMLEKVSDNVNSIDELNYYFEKYGINKCMKLLIVTLMKNERKVSKLLKVDIMTSIIKRYIYSVIDANSPLISYNFPSPSVHCPWQPPFYLLALPT